MLRIVRRRIHDGWMEPATTQLSPGAETATEAANASAPGPPPADGEPRITELRPGMSFQGRFACARKDRLTSRNGSPYLALSFETAPARCRPACFAMPIGQRRVLSVATRSASGGG